MIKTEKIMIYSKFSYNNFEKPYLKIIDDFLKENDLIQMEKGKHLIDGENFFVNICDYQTTTKENRVWEAHRYYIDVHVMIKGSELLQHTFIENANIKKFHEDEDYVEIPDVKKVESEIILDEGQYLIFDSNDVHKTAIMVDKSSNMVRKAIFKIKIK